MAYPADSMSVMDPPEEPIDELRQLTRGLRAQLVRHVAAGAWAAPGGATARSVIVPFDVAGRRPGRRRAERARSALARRRSAPSSASARAASCPRRASRSCSASATRDAPLMFVGEAPGEQEDRRGEPFVGPAGELLDKMIEAMGWSRADGLHPNILMCRPPGNRNPQPDEVEQCMPFLDAQIGVDRAAHHRRARPPGGEHAARHRRADQLAARQVPRSPRRQGDADVPSGVSCCASRIASATRGAISSS